MTCTRTLTPLDARVLRAVRDLRWYPSEPIAESVGDPLEAVRGSLNHLRRVGLVDGYGSGRTSLGVCRWALTRDGQDVLLDRERLRAVA